MSSLPEITADIAASVRFSVVVTTYKRYQELAECLASIQAQTLPVFEVLVVDDGGNGQTQALVEQYGARYLWQENAGQQKARNTGAAQARGDWIVFMDDDDCWTPDRHALLQACTRAADTDFIATNFRTFSDEGEDSETVFEAFAQRSPEFWRGLPRHDGQDHSFVGSFPSMRLFPASPFWPSMLAVRRDLYERLGGWDTGLRGIRTEDFDFTFRAVRQARMSLIWKPTIRYRSHSGNHTNVDSRVLQGRAGVWSHLLAHQTLSAEERSLVEGHIRDALLAAHWAAFEEKDYAAVKRIGHKLGWRRLKPAAMVKSLLAQILG